MKTGEDTCDPGKSKSNKAAGLKSQFLGENNETGKLLCQRFSTLTELKSGPG